MNLVSVRDVCQPRDEVLAGKSSMEVYAASLSQVVQGKAPDVYQDAARFFENTYPTEGLKTTVREVFSRIGGRGAGSPVIKLETSLGGGKTHSLIALYHLAKLGSKAAPPKVVGDISFGPLKVVAIVGTEIGTAAKKGEPSTLWGEIARQLGRYDVVRAADEARTPPGEGALRDLFGNEKTLLLVDEIALYLVKASAVPVGDSTLARQTIAFLQELTTVAGALDNVSLVITSLNKQSVFADQTEELQRVLDRDVQQAKAAKAVQEADEVISRLVRNLTPTSGAEFPNVVRHRLFQSVNRSAAIEVCKSYHQSLKSDGVREFVPKHATDPKYLEYLQESYPFHPELIQILRTKTGSISQFNQTRGVLRLLSLLVKHIWEKGIETPLIHPHHLDFKVPTFREELISRLDRTEYLAAVTQDIADTRTQPRAAHVDESFQQPLGTWLCTTAFLHSLTGAVGADIRRGANESELQLAVHSPGMDPKAVERALTGLEDNCFYLVKQGSMYTFNTEPNLNKVIERAKNDVEGTQVLKEIEKRIEQIYGGRKYFTPCIFANEPSRVPDDTEKPKLVVVHFNEGTSTGTTTRAPDVVDKIFHEQGNMGKPRIYSNNLVFLVADKEEAAEQGAMRLKAREFLALHKLWDDIQGNAPGVSDLGPNQRAKIKEKRGEAELFLKVAIVVAYKYLFVPTTQKDLESAQGRKPLRKLTIRVTDTEVAQRQRQDASEEGYLVTFLRNNNVARTVDDKPLEPDFVLDRLWPKNTHAVTGDEFKKLFYKNPSADLVFSPELVTKAQQAGVTAGKWYGILGQTFYDKTNASTFSGAFSAELQITLVDTEEGKDAWLQFNDPRCKKRRTQCVCDKAAQEGGVVVVAPPPPPPRGALPLIEHKMLSGVVGALAPLLEDREVEDVVELELRPKNREDLTKLALALPQFHGAEISFKLDAVLDTRHKGGNLLKLTYEGDARGFQDLKPVLVNYEGRSPFSMATLSVTFRWPKGLAADALVALLRDKVEQFTQDAIFSAQVTPKPKEGAK